MKHVSGANAHALITIGCWIRPGGPGRSARKRRRIQLDSVNSNSMREEEEEKEHTDVKKVLNVVEWLK
jgi:hypothetical protein